MSDRWHLKSGEVFDSEERGVALISTTYLARGAGPLIASAPDLLEALKAIEADCTELADGCEEADFTEAERRTYKALAAKANAAIAKAENRS